MEFLVRESMNNNYVTKVNFNFFFVNFAFDGGGGGRFVFSGFQVSFTRW